MTTSLRTQDLHFVVSRIPRDVMKVVKEHNLFIAGGFLRSTISDEKASDIDLFGSSVEQLKLVASLLTVERQGRMHTTDNAFTVLSGNRIPVQFISKWLYAKDEAAKLLQEFDFTIAQAVLWWENEHWQSLISDDFYADCAAKRLVYTHPNRAEAAGGSLLRVRKFVAKGYSIQPKSLAGVISRLFLAVHSQEGDWSEDWLTKVLCGLLREVDPMRVVDGVDLVDEHEVT